MVRVHLGPFFGGIMDTNYIKKSRYVDLFIVSRQCIKDNFFVGIDIGVNFNNKLQRFKDDDFSGA